MTKPAHIGQLIGVGVGPGDPELVTLKACRLIRQAAVVSYLVNAQGHSQAKEIARLALADAPQNQVHLPIQMAFSEQRDAANAAYDLAAQHIAAHLKAGRDVVVLCEGDTLFFGSFSYLLQRLVDYPSLVVPGISSPNAAAAALQLPLTVLNESYAVLSGRHSSEQLIDALTTFDSVVIMKAGRSRQKIINAIQTAKRSKQAVYLEYIGREQQRICHDITTLSGEEGPYFSLFMVLNAHPERGPRHD